MRSLKQKSCNDLYFFHNTSLLIMIQCYYAAQKENAGEIFIVKCGGVWKHGPFFEKRYDMHGSVDDNYCQYACRRVWWHGCLN